MPVKRYVKDAFPEVGLVHRLFGYIVFECSLYEIPETIDEFLRLPQRHYKSWEEMHAKGWSID